MTLTDSGALGYFDSFEIAENEDTCATYGGKQGEIGYTEEIETYVHISFTNADEGPWRFGTYEELYNTVYNGGEFPWDDNAPTDNKFLGMKDGAQVLALTFFALAS